MVCVLLGTQECLYIAVLEASREQVEQDLPLASREQVEQREGLPRTRDRLK